MTRKTLQEISEQLKLRIAQGAYAPGQRLLEKDLVEQFGVSRGRMREVLRNLVGEGLLDFEEQRGVRIRRLTRKTAMDIGRVREMVEGLAARQAAEKELDDAASAQFRLIAEQMNAAVEARDAELFGRLNKDFHDLIVATAGNEVLSSTLDRLRVPLFRLQFYEGMTTETLPERNRDHQEIAKAILDGVPDRAEEAMRQHVRGGNARLVELADRIFG
jgi:DNA-binding GntR family transcriptional regulator